MVVKKQSKVCSFDDTMLVDGRYNNFVFQLFQREKKKTEREREKERIDQKPNFKTKVEDNFDRHACR